MATRTLRLVFRNPENENRNITMNIANCNDETSASVIKAAAAALIENSEIFVDILGELVSAGFVTPMRVDNVDIS